MTGRKKVPISVYLDPDVMATLADYAAVANNRSP
jgi:hypothetical protein